MKLLHRWLFPSLSRRLNELEAAHPKTIEALNTANVALQTEAESRANLERSLKAQHDRIASEHTIMQQWIERLQAPVLAFEAGRNIIASPDMPLVLRAATYLESIARQEARAK